MLRLPTRNAEDPEKRQGPALGNSRESKRFGADHVTADLAGFKPSSGILCDEPYTSRRLWTGNAKFRNLTVFW